MKTNNKGIELIKKEESFQPRMYICPAGYPTIGYGTVIDTEDEEYLKDAIINEAKAEKLLAHDLEYFEKAVKNMIRVPLNENQFSALCSFCYNVGPGNLKSSTLLKKVNNNPDDPTIYDEFQKWVYANGKKLRGLEKRRIKEAELFFL